MANISSVENAPGPFREAEVPAGLVAEERRGEDVSSDEGTPNVEGVPVRREKDCNLLRLSPPLAGLEIEFALGDTDREMGF